jgi:hypothetical protein
LTDHDDAPQAASGGSAEHADHGEHAIHLPPNSWTPLSGALALALIFVGFLGDVRNSIGPTMWVIGLVLLAGTCVVWARGARTEYLSLPEDQQH